MALDDHGLALSVVEWNPLAMAMSSSRGHHKCRHSVNLISLRVFG